MGSEQTAAPTGAKKKGAAAATDLPRLPYNRILAVDSDNARLVISDKEVKERAEDIKANGLLQPIGVRLIKNPELTEDERAALGLDEDDETPDLIGRVVYGFRRYYAIGEIIGEDDTSEFATLGVPYIPLNGEPKDDVFANLAENVGRKDLSPAELAARFHLMKSEMGFTAEQIAQRLGLSKGYVQGLISLKAKLSDPAWEAFLGGKLTYDVAKEIQKAGDEDAQKAALEAVLGVVESAENEGKKKKRGAKKAAKAAAKGKKGDDAPTPSRPGVKAVKEKHAEWTEKAGDEPSPYHKGVLMALSWVMGDRKNIPTPKAKAK